MTLLSPFPITKMQGTGNDFLIFNALSEIAYTSLKEFLNESDRSNIAKKLRERNTSLGADGLVFLDPSPNKDFDFQWDFYNADGSKAEMCGNAARCVALYAFKNNFSKKKEIKFLTLAGSISASIDKNDIIKIQMTPINETTWNKKLQIDDNQIEYAFINSGVPHAVIELENFQRDESLKSLSKKIQLADDFKPTSTNVTYLSTISTEPNSLSLKTASFERGVFDFTLACGTGAVAAAYYFANKHSLKNQSIINVQVPGGELKISFNDNQPFLSGPAKFISESQIHK